MLAGNPVYSACNNSSCIPLGNDLSMNFCLEYQAVQYEFKLNYIQDSSGFSGKWILQRSSKFNLVPEVVFM
jgi:hypothetical protein